MADETDTPQDESPADAAKRKFREALDRNAANAHAQQAHQNRAKVQGSSSGAAWQEQEGPPQDRLTLAPTVEELSLAVPTAGPGNSAFPGHPGRSSRPGDRPAPPAARGAGGSARPGAGEHARRDPRLPEGTRGRTRGRPRRTGSELLGRMGDER